MLVMNPGAYEDQLDLPEIPVDSRIELPEGKAGEINKIKAVAATANNAEARLELAGQRKSPHCIQRLRWRRQTLTKEEIGSPFENFLHTD